MEINFKQLSVFAVIFLVTALLISILWPRDGVSDGDWPLNQSGELTDVSRSTEERSVERQVQTGDSPEQHQKDAVNWASFLSQMSKEQQEAYLKLNNELFGLLKFSNEAEFGVLIQNGFPLVADIEFASGYKIQELSNMVMDENSALHTKIAEQKINIKAVRVVNFVNAIQQAEKVIGYYIPDYTFNPEDPLSINWPNGETPEQVKEAITDLVFAHASVKSDTALGSLARAQFHMVMQAWNQERREISELELNYFSQAGRLMPQLEIDAYISKRYPEHYQHYIELKMHEVY